MTKVWVGTAGEYSDFGIHGIFTTREKAEEWAKDHNKRFARVPGYQADYEEWELDRAEINENGKDIVKLY